MRRIVYWWCLKDAQGKLWPITARETKKGVLWWTDISRGEAIVKVRVEEVRAVGKRNPAPPEKGE